MPANQRYATIDLLRIFSAAAVVAFHYGYLFPAYASAFPLLIQAVASHGYLGVECFS